MSEYTDIEKELFSEASAGAKNDNASDQFNLGMCYYFGTGVEVDKILGHKWFKISLSKISCPSWESELTRETNKEQADALVENMTPKEMAEAEKLADEWIKANRKTN